MFPATRVTQTPRQAKAEVAKRELAKRYFGDFCTYVDGKFLAVPHARFLTEKLEQVARYIETGGKEGISRLMILMPPRHGKTELASIKFPAWLLGRLPDSRVILTSYGADLAAKNSRQMRDLVGSKRYQAVFGIKSGRNDPVMIAADSHSVQAWNLAQPHRGGAVATGVGGGITGLGATLLVIDDPFKNREEAESQGRRDMVDDWYKSSAYTRLEQHGAVILFHTRWHPDDLAGRLLKRMATDPLADQWEIVCLPALAMDSYPIDLETQRNLMLDGVYLPVGKDTMGRQPGQALWPERFSAEWLFSRRTNVGAYDFEALYQQLPYLKDGQRYKREWFATVAKLPEGVTIKYILRYWDKANSVAGDYTVGVLMCLASDGYFYILNVVRGQWSSYERDQIMLKTSKHDAEKYGSVRTWHQQDPGSAGKDSAEATNRLLVGFPAFFEPVTGDKETRSEPLESAFQGGLVKLIQAHWNEAFVSELCAFPKGKNDDQVDAASSAFTKLANGGGEHRTVSSAPVMVSVDDLFGEQLSVFGNSYSGM
jgi:predicted phage terminase large subunit-like protein